VCAGVFAGTLGVGGGGEFELSRVERKLETNYCLTNLFAVC
jgi:hypothetical protein